MIFFASLRLCVFALKLVGRNTIEPGPEFEAIDIYDPILSKVSKNAGVALMCSPRNPLLPL
jgi:hypothetical protein